MGALRVDTAFARGRTPWPHGGALEALDAVSRSAGPNLEAFVRAHGRALVHDMRLGMDRQGVGPGRLLDQRLRRADRDLDPDLARRAAIAGLALGLPARGPCRPLPDSIEALYPRAYEALAASLADDTSPYDSDSYAKDARFVAGMSVPAGAQIVDIAFAQGPRAGLRHLAQMGAMSGRLAIAGAGLAAATQLFKGQGLGHWVEIHTDSRDLADFSEPGWDACYRRIADLLALNPDIAGMWGASWFYDPQLRTISPRLAYLQDRPLERGAVAIRLGEGDIHTRRAAQTSPTRADLIARGAYRPVCYALFWPRAALIAWAGR
ncbi:hypothetical protein ACO2Q3_15230 [Caulobacter sp. KR2-114]|uniref:hypothetical protein n=1 Tax=Caulobacter sp. KR2-114 TaxID=3400912 RepID=UPI003C0C09BF